MGKIRSTNQAATPVLHTVDPAADELLHNWARWTESQRGGAAGEGVWRFASRGVRAAAYATATVVPVDTAAARRVESTVCSPRFSPLFRDVLKAHWVINAMPSATCRALGLHHGRYEETVCKAAAFFLIRYRADWPGLWRCSCASNISPT